MSVFYSFGIGLVFYALALEGRGMGEGGRE